MAGEKYEAALKIKPDDHEVFNEWGIALAVQARTKTGKEADRLLTLASEKYQAALKIRPDKHEVLHNWGLALEAQAQTKKGKHAKQLRELAGEKLSAARAIAPHLYPVDDRNQEAESQAPSIRN